MDEPLNRINLRPVISATTNWKQVELGEANLKAVRAFFASHPCCTQRECAKALGLSPMAVNRHSQSIRREWRGKEHNPDV